MTNDNCPMTNDKCPGFLLPQQILGVEGFVGAVVGHDFLDVVFCFVKANLSSEDAGIFSLGAL
jgi:hypothetical protein